MDEREMLTIKQAAKIIGCVPPTLRVYVQDDEKRQKYLPGAERREFRRGTWYWALPADEVIRLREHIHPYGPRGPRKPKND